MKKELFGVPDSFTAASAAQFRISLRMPTIYVYIVSTNPAHATTLASLFQGLPCWLYQLSAADFVQDGVIYNGIGVDRVANIAAAQSVYHDAPSVLVIDGGTAMTYTATLPMRNGKSQLGGGIGAGLKMKLRALYDYTSNLPLVRPEALLELVVECSESRTPLPLFPTSDNVEQAMLGTVLTETAQLLCGVLHGWLTQQQQQPNETSALPTVVITGGDGDLYEKLLLPHHSFIVTTNEANLALLNAAQLGRNGDAANKRFMLDKDNHLPHFGVQHVLFSRKFRGDDDEAVRRRLLGQRVTMARRKKPAQHGTIVGITRGATLDQDVFAVFYEESNTIDDALDISMIYGTCI